MLMIGRPRKAMNLRRLRDYSKRCGLEIKSAAQTSADGLTQVLVMDADFVAGHPSAHVSCRSTCYGNDFASLLRLAGQAGDSEAAVARHVHDLRRSGTGTLHRKSGATSIAGKTEQLRAPSL